MVVRSAGSQAPGIRRCPELFGHPDRLLVASFAGKGLILMTTPQDVQRCASGERGSRPVAAVLAADGCHVLIEGS
jgi:hypothetical protein